jgi:hypothetical protein
VNERFEDLVGGVDDLQPEERDRLRRMHELLLQVDAPANVPAGLGLAPPAVAVEPPAEQRAHRPWRRLRPALILVAAALAAAAFGAGYVLGDRDVESVAVIQMTAVGSGRSAATGSIELLPADESGNWPMRVLIRGLEPSVGRQDYYELWLTKNGKLAAPCGHFTVHEGLTTVTLSVPYKLRAYDGWVVTHRGSDQPLLSTT